MKSGKFLFLAMILLVSLLCISAVSAADEAVSDVIADTNDVYVLEGSINDADLRDSQNEELGQSDENALSDEGDPTPPPATPSFYLLSDKIVNGGDEVNLTEDYVYQPMTESHFQKGINITRNLTINGNGHSIDGKNQARIFYVYPDCNVTFKDIVFINGNATDEDDFGGAICGNGSAVCTAINCTFINNTATNCGAFNGEAINCTFINNTATKMCGAFSGNATNCFFSQNSAEAGGALVFTYAINCTFKNNNAKYGGAIVYGEVANSSFSQNTAGEYGGAILFGNAENCTFNSNSASRGGAMVNSTASNCNFTQNTAIYGGAIENGTVYNSIFTKNIATQYCGAINFGNATNCTFIENKAFYEVGAFAGNATNCRFIKNSANEYAGAFAGNATNCTFIENYAMRGGAMGAGNATNCSFTQNTALSGGAICEGNAFDCNFTENTAKVLIEFMPSYGGAIYRGNAYNCNFIKNSAQWGGAIFETDATNCTFIQNSADYGGAISTGNATNCTFILNSATVASNDAIGIASENCNFIVPVFTASDFKTVYNSGEKFIFTLGAEGHVLDGVKTIISIYKGSAFVANYSALSGEGWTVNLPAGTYKAILSVAGSDVEPVTKTITVAKNPTAITASAVTATYNVNKYLTIKLTDANGKALSGVKVTVTLGTAKTYTTDKNGQIKINVANLVPKTYTAKIAYAGNANYLASTKSVKVVVKKASPKMTAKAKSFKASVKTKKYTITLKNNKGAVMKKVKLTLKVGKKTYKATTNSKGKATFKITKLTKKGKYTATIKFAGSKYYNKLTKKVKITVKK